MKNKIMKIKQRAFSLVLASALLLTTVGCGNVKTSKVGIDLSGETEANEMPISKEPITIKWWTPLYGNIKSYNDNEMFKEMEKKTGIHIEFISPPKGQEDEQYGVMLASKDLPDIIERRGDQIYPGGIQRGVEEGFFLDLTDYINKYAPNIKKFMEDEAQYRDAMILQNGSIGSVRGILSEPELPWRGPVIRKDLLDKINADIPRTPDELYEVLKRFKDELNIKYPMVLDSTARHIPPCGFTSGWNTGVDMYYGEDETYHFGPYDDNYGEMLKDLQQWYAEGLIDSEFAARDDKTIETAIANGDVGFACVSSDSIEYYNEVGKRANADYEMVTIPYLVPEKGNKTTFGGSNMSILSELGAAIVSTSEHPVECIKLLDYMFSQEGADFCNYGVKDKTYTVDENGVKRYTEFFKNNPDGIEAGDMIYLWGRNEGAFYKETNRGMSQEEIDALPSKQWTVDVEAAKTSPEIQFSTAQMDENTTCWQDINTYAPQFITKYIMGMSDAGSWEVYKEKMKNFGMEKILKNFNDCAAEAKSR